MAGQHITFGWYLDGQRATLPVNSLGYSVVGPLGFLNILETQLGLLANHASQAERIVQFRDCLQQVDAEQRFYHRSFAMDPLGTAAYLLDWRDQWHLHGWDGSMPVDAPRRLRDMADVEVLAGNAVALNIGQRLHAVYLAMQDRSLAIDEVLLVDEFDIFPSRWQVILKALPVVRSDQRVGTGRGFLGQLQQQLQLAATGQTTSKIDWQHDGSVWVVQAETSTLLHHWLATQFDSHQQTLLVSDDGDARLDAQLVVAGMPRQGLKEVSAFRPALQVLPLALELLWDPLNFYALVQFLTHSVCPVPGYARRRLAEKVADAPGIGGAYWQSTLTQIKEHYGEEHWDDVRDQIAFWIEHERFSTNTGAPLNVVIARVERLLTFFRLRLGEMDDARRFSFHAGFGQCQSCLDSLQELQSQGVLLIRPRQLQKLVSHATANGSDNPLWVAEVGAGQLASQPGAVIEPTERLIWSQLRMPVLPGNDAWSESEFRTMRKIGVDLPSGPVRLDQVARSWLRPVMAAQDQLVLILPPTGEEIHPVWQMIEAVVNRPDIIQLESLLINGGTKMTRVTPLPLPLPKRWWQLPENISVDLRPQESFSSLEKLLFNPYQWLLQYPARLRSSRIVSLGGDFRILGNLAHEMVEQYFLHPDALSMSDDALYAWFDSAFETWVDQQAAILKMPGRGADKVEFRHRLFLAIRNLRAQARKANMVQVVPELPVSGHYPGGELTGMVDIMMQNAWGHCAVIDMKWSGSKKFSEKLRQNSQLQLAIYAELLRQKNGSWPSVAYYILDGGRFFAPDNHVFPDAEAVPSGNGENTAQLWQRFVTSWHWRVAQIKSGQFEVVLESIPADDDSNPPQDAMAAETLNPAYNDYLSLAGWEN